ncbi:MAG TPA: hypothetical protein VI278_05590 [Nitrososphaeraceae archaeon]|jgi:hypothetical protein
MKLDLPTNATLVDDAIRFVSSNVSKDKETAKENEEVEDKTINKIF